MSKLLSKFHYFSPLCCQSPCLTVLFSSALNLINILDHLHLVSCFQGNLLSSDSESEEEEESVNFVDMWKARSTPPIKLPDWDPNKSIEEHRKRVCLPPLGHIITPLLLNPYRVQDKNKYFLLL